MARPDIPSAKWVGLPASYTSGRKAKQPTIIFIHTTEGNEGPTSAEDGAAYDRRRTDGTSTHLFVDSNSIVQEVEFKDEAHAARSHGNDVGIQVEVCGRAGQTKTQWADAASAATIKQLIRACYEIRKVYGRGRFPLVNLTPTQLAAGASGFAEHRDATFAWPGDHGSHEDPGPNFPWSDLFNGIRALEDKDDHMARREYKMLAVSGHLPELRRGDNDTEQGGTWWIHRAQQLLGVKADGDFGGLTAAALKTRMAKFSTSSSEDGSVIGLPEWKVLYGI